MRKILFFTVTLCFFISEIISKDYNVFNDTDIKISVDLWLNAMPNNRWGYIVLEPKEYYRFRVSDMLIYNWGDTIAIKDIRDKIPAGDQKVPQLNFGLGDGRDAEYQLYIIRTEPLNGKKHGIFKISEYWSRASFGGPGWSGAIKDKYDEYIAKGFAPTANEMGK